MAIDKVVLYQNTSVIQDEILAHRLGLVPIKANPDKFQPKQKSENFNNENCLKFYINVKCTRKEEYANTPIEELKKLKPEEYLNNAIVYAEQFKWIPLENQKDQYREGDEPKVLHPKLLFL